MSGRRAAGLLVLALVSVAPFPLAEATSSGDLSFHAPVPCWWACPGSVCDLFHRHCDPSPAPDVVRKEAGCMPTPLAPPRSYDEEAIPLDPAASSLDIFVGSSAGAFELMACRTTPDASGRYLLASSTSGICGGSADAMPEVCAGILLPEYASLRLDTTTLEDAGILVRVFNYDVAYETWGSWDQR